MAYKTRIYAAWPMTMLRVITTSTEQMFHIHSWFHQYSGSPQDVKIIRRSILARDAFVIIERIVD